MSSSAIGQDANLHRLRELVRLNAGQRLPGERELTAELGISRPRLRLLLEILEREGLVERRQGSGTYALDQGAHVVRRVVLLVDAALKLGNDPFFSRLVELLQSELQYGAIQCLLQRTNGETFSLPRCEGVLALGATALANLQPSICSTQPCVGMFAPATSKPGRNLTLLGLEDSSAGAKAAQRAVELGSNHVYFFGRQGVPAVKERLIGVRSVLEPAGIAVTPVECGLHYTAGLEQGLRFSNGADGKSTLIAANDWLAFGLHTGLQSQSMQLRASVNLLSFDALPVTQRAELGIESLAVPLETIAQDAVSELLRLYKGKTVGRAIRYELEWRNQTSGTA